MEWAWTEASGGGGGVRHAKASVCRIERAVDEGWARRSVGVWVSGLKTNWGLDRIMCAVKKREKEHRTPILF